MLAMLCFMISLWNDGVVLGLFFFVFFLLTFMPMQYNAMLQ